MEPEFQPYGLPHLTVIALTIVLLITHTRSPWSVALHRFVEVSLGIAVALLIAKVWPIPGSRVD